MLKQMLLSGLNGNTFYVTAGQWDDPNGGDQNREIGYSSVSGETYGSIEPDQYLKRKILRCCTRFFDYNNFEANIFSVGEKIADVLEIRLKRLDNGVEKILQWSDTEKVYLEEKGDGKSGFFSESDNGRIVEIKIIPN